jgi:NitT/TauT family transport system permease protein
MADADARASAAWGRADPREQAILARESADAVRRDRRVTVSVAAWQLGLLAALVAAWGAASGRLVDHLFVSDPASVAAAFGRIVADGTLWFNLRYTLIETLAGYVLGAAAGLVAAVLTWLIPGGEPVLRPLILLAYATPKIALAPLLILWFGIGLLPKVLLAAVFVFFIVFLNTLAGLATASPGLIQVVRVMGAGPIAVFRKIVLPGASPFIVAALRITVPAALIGAVVGEFISSNRGVGYLISAASTRYRTADVFAAILGLLIVVVLMNAGVSALERSWMRWAPRERSPLG